MILSIAGNLFTGFDVQTEIFFSNGFKNRTFQVKIPIMRNIYVLAFIAFLGLTSCRFMGKRVHGNGVIKTIEQSVSSFQEVEANGDIKLLVTQGDLKPVKIEGDENIISLIEVIQEGDKIIIQPKDGYNLHPTGDLNIYVTSPKYKSIEVSGSSDIVGENKITNTEEISLGASGSGDIKMELDAPKISAGISGSGSVNLKGQAKDLDISLSGAGHAYCYELLTENTTIEISGAGSAQVYASVNLKAEVSGAGTINYKGNAKVSQSISGAGSVNRTD